LDYEHSVGLAVIGSVVNSYTVKEQVHELLQHLQHIPGYTDFSMEGISKLVHIVFMRATNELYAIMKNNGLCQLILGGYCPLQERIRIFKHSVDSDGTMAPTHAEILVTDGIDFFGSPDALTAARKAYARIGNNRPLHVVRDVVKDPAITSVDGGLQYGEFAYQDFKVYGVEDFIINADGSVVDILFTLRGLHLYKGEFQRDEEGFHIAHTFKQPFESEIKAAFDAFLAKTDRS